MIKNHDRSKWFGASDTHYIMGKWTSKTFCKWWCVKLGLLKNGFQTKATLAGTHYEHKIAGEIAKIKGEKLKLDRQFKVRKLRLRVNLDAETKDTICEIKTFKACDNWKLPESYKMQVRVQGYFAHKKCEIWAYPMTKEHYRNYFLEIEPSKLLKFEVEQDDDFIAEYIKRVEYLAKCLKIGKMPDENEYKEKIKNEQIYWNW